MLHFSSHAHKRDKIDISNSDSCALIILHLSILHKENKTFISNCDSFNMIDYHTLETLFQVFGTESLLMVIFPILVRLKTYYIICT